MDGGEPRGELFAIFFTGVILMMVSLYFLLKQAGIDLFLTPDYIIAYLKSLGL
jgi:hypothetical protein